MRTVDAPYDWLIAIAKVRADGVDRASKICFSLFVIPHLPAFKSSKNYKNKHGS